jgi:hypothetical protein
VVGGSLGGLRAGVREWDRRISQLPHRAAPLVAAIAVYERDHLGPPPSLSDLVPAYLPKLPHTGFNTDWIYLTSPSTFRLDDSDPWALVVLTGHRHLGLRRVIYQPNGRYASRGYAILEKRVDGWAVVLERGP